MPHMASPCVYFSCASFCVIDNEAWRGSVILRVVSFVSKYLNLHSTSLEWAVWIQNVADLRRNSHIGKVFELAEPHFRHDMEHNIRIRPIFPDRNRNCILNHWLINKNLHKLNEIK